MTSSGDGESATSTTVEVTDAVPLLHSSLDVTPTVEMALEQAAAHAAACDGQALVGYYHANELAADDRVGRSAAKIADAVATNAGRRAGALAGGCPACVLLIDPARLGRSVAAGADGEEVSRPAVTLYTRRGGAWERAADQAGELAVIGGGCAKAAACHARGMETALVDFDDHLDDLTKDWRNGTLDDAIARA